MILVVADARLLASIRCFFGYNKIELNKSYPSNIDESCQAKTDTNKDFKYSDL